MAVSDKRRSDRLTLTILLRIEGIDPEGKAFSIEARSINISRHGARVQVSYPLHCGQIVRLINPVGSREAEFRVVGPLAPPTESVGQYALECLDPQVNFWKIEFPPPKEGEANEAKALLECRRCHTVALLALTLIEMEVLRTIGLLVKPCPSCLGASPWGCAEKPEMMLATQAQIEAAPPKPNLRRHRRVCLQLPVLVRDYYGGVEIVETENVSKAGCCFGSEKNYYASQALLLVIPYGSQPERVEMRGLVAYRREIVGASRKLYGIHYLPQTS